MSGLLGSAAVVLIVALFIFGPWLLFWAIGVLFGVTIPLTFKTWLAAVVFLGLVRGGSS